MGMPAHISCTNSDRTDGPPSSSAWRSTSPASVSSLSSPSSRQRSCAVTMTPAAFLSSACSPTKERAGWSRRSKRMQCSSPCDNGGGRPGGRARSDCCLLNVWQY
eukprot:312912-Prymnesium_polylepis.3